MKASAMHRSNHIAAAPTIALDEASTRYWSLAVITACAASWAAIFGAAKLLLALI